MVLVGFLYSREGGKREIDTRRKRVAMFTGGKTKVKFWTRATESRTSNYYPTYESDGRE